MTAALVLAYADGSCVGNPGPGGWGVVIVRPSGVNEEFSGFEARTTNNRMEITAAIETLRHIPRNLPVAIRSDSQYLVKTITDNWRRNENRDLWALLDEELLGRRVSFEWVRGHADDPHNQRADELAREAAKRGGGAQSPTSSSTRGGTGKAKLISQLASLLEPGERLAECMACGRLFVVCTAERVPPAAKEAYCSAAQCQLVARRQRRPS